MRYFLLTFGWWNPFLDATHQQDVFNYRLSRAPLIIENAFEKLSARWRIFHRPIRANVNTVEYSKKATVFLHNYLLLTENSSYTPAGFTDSWSTTGQLIAGKCREEVRTNGSVLGSLRRQAQLTLHTLPNKWEKKFVSWLPAQSGH